MENEQSQSLFRFFQSDEPTIKAFLEAAIKTAIKSKDVTLLATMLDASVSFEHYLDGLFDIDDSQLLSRALLQVPPLCLSGDAGGKLLFKLAGRGDIETGKVLVSCGANVNTVTIAPHPWYKTFTPLCNAAEMGKLGMVRFLLNSGADINLKLSNADWKRQTALGVAISFDQIEIAEELLSRGAALAVSEPMLRWTSLHSRHLYGLLRKDMAEDDYRPNAGDILVAAAQGQAALSRYVQIHRHLALTTVLEEALCEAVSYERFSEAAFLLGQGVNPNAVSQYRRPLQEAMCLEEGGSDYIRLLIQAGADPNIPGLLSSGSGTMDVSTLSLLVASGIDLQEQGPEALVQAASDENITAVKFLLDKGVDINAPGRKFTALQAAVLSDKPQYDNRDCASDTVRYLIRRGADINAPPLPDGGRTALQAACVERPLSTVVVDFLLDKGAQVNGPVASRNGITALEGAALAGKDGRQICEKLLDYGASVQRPDGGPSHLLHNLIGRDWQGTGLFTRVLEKGALVSEMAKVLIPVHGFHYAARTPIQYAAELGNLDAVKLLLGHGADVNEPASHDWGRTALQAAAAYKSGDSNMVEFLIAKGAAVNAEPAMICGITALQGAAISGNIKIATMLLGHGADVNAEPALEKGRYAIEGAAEHGRLDMVQLLLNAGAKGDLERGTGFKRAIAFAEAENHLVVANLLRAAEEGRVTENPLEG
ncbi:hypothetical protein DL765_005523 [Monosporascus sp. GIB2]|nr:hypothetical protein DL765_005523 [Monosporascus sp. GIB2]